jgi:glycosyltransferase involved in cell wall biosynthesis
MDAVVCVSARQAAKVRQAGVPSVRTHVIHNAIDVNRFINVDRQCRRQLADLFAKPPRFFVGAAGRLSPEKGFGILVAAAERVTKERADVGFVLFGDGPLREELRADIAQRGLGDRVILAGFRKNLDQWLPALDALAIPSFTEGLPNVALEAFAARVPVVGTDVGGIPEVVEDAVNGYVVPPGDPDSLARGLLDMLADDTRRKEMADRGFRHVQDVFTFPRQAERYRQLFEDVIASRS